ncbi:NADPH oxidase organizer 1a [Gasterosteus aculeatus]
MEVQRYPISISLIGVLHKQKCKMYMTSVLWSDENEIVVYRTFVDFKKMHKQMKKLFDKMKMKRSDRLIPKFRDKMGTGNVQKKSPTKSLLRLKLLQRYCNELLSSDPQVSQCPDLIQFFHPNADDLQPDFAKNSAMVLPSDDELRADGAPVTGGNVTKPFVTETYRCVAVYETKDTKNKPFKVALNEQLDVLIKDKAGWWLVENEDKRMAWFPAPYLEKVKEDDDDDDDEDEDDLDGDCERGLRYTAVKTYKATKDDEITVPIGSVVEVLQKSDNGWWLIRHNTKAGYIPTMYLQPYKYPHIRMTGNHQARRSSSPQPIMSQSLEVQQSNQLSLSQGNLLQLPTIRSSTPKPDQPRRERSSSLDILSEEPLSRPDNSAAAAAIAAAAAATAAAAAAAKAAAAASAAASAAAKVDPVPTIMVEMENEMGRRTLSPRADSEGSFSSNSDYSDDLNASWESSTSFSLSQSYNEQQLRGSITPTPVASNRLDPQSIRQGKMMPSISDPNLYKGPTAPTVPPRPKTKEILSRCTTITRKNAAKGSHSPTKTEIIGH